MRLLCCRAHTPRRLSGSLAAQCFNQGALSLRTCGGLTRGESGAGLLVTSRLRQGRWGEDTSLRQAQWNQLGLNKSRRPGTPLGQQLGHHVAGPGLLAEAGREWRMLPGAQAWVGVPGAPGAVGAGHVSWRPPPTPPQESVCLSLTLREQKRVLQPREAELVPSPKLDPQNQKSVGL